MTVEEYVKKDIDYLNPNALAEDLAMTSAMYYTASSKLAELTKQYTDALAKKMLEAENMQINAKAKEQVAKSNCSDIKELLDKATSIIYSLEMRQKTLITLISKAKEEMRMTQGG